MEKLIRSVSPRVRIAALLALIIATSLLGSWQMLLLLAALGLVLALAAGLSLRAVLKRLFWLLWLGAGLLLTLPLAVPGTPVFQLPAGPWTLAPTQAGLALAGLLCLRMLGCFLLALALAASTPAPELLEALGQLGVPQLFVVLAGVALRYISVLRDEARRQALSRRSRGYRPEGSILHRRTLRHYAQMVGMLLLRAYDRSERIYWAMISRGYSLKRRPVPVSRFSSGERWALGAALAFAVCLLLLDRQVMGGG